MRLCLRCFQHKEVDVIGNRLNSFICSTCRTDVSEWSFKEPKEVRDVEVTPYDGGFDETIIS